jgi:hypothetical protein
MKHALKPIIVISVIANVIFGSLLLAPYIAKWRANGFQSNAKIATPATPKNNLFDEVNPTAGFSINASLGDLGPKMISLGVIDADKFIATYEKSNQPLTAEQKQILLKGSDTNITINRENSYFLLNFFWAVGLANKSTILEEGDMMKYGGKQGAGNFASTGGWSLAKGDAMNYYAKSALIPLTKDQESRVNLVASNIFRPCCNNSTAFPDCNHGMALLGVLQLMASNGATEKEMYEAGKYVNAFWFPGNYYDLALYFQNKEGKSFKDIDAKVLLSKEFSSASGWQSAKQWLADKNLIQQPPKQSGGCGV